MLKNSVDKIWKFIKKLKIYFCQEKKENKKWNTVNDVLFDDHSTS